MKILAIEWSSPYRGAAAVEGDAGGEWLVRAVQIEAGSEKVNALQVASNVMEEAGWQPTQVDRLVVGLGPGSYAGIRSALAIAQGWNIANGTPAAGVPSDLVLAETARMEGIRGQVRVLIDAQRGEYYTSLYELSDRVAKELDPLRLAEWNTLPEGNAGKERWIGPEPLPGGRSIQIVSPSPVTLGKLGAYQDLELSPETLEPVYLRAVEFVKAAPARFAE